MTTDTRPNPVVSPPWVADHLDDPDLRVVEVDFDRSAYDRGHVPGAIAWSWATDLSDPVARDIAGREQVAALLERSGIAADTHVVLYGTDNWYAAWAFWQLRLYGFERISLIDGGRDHWLAQGLPLATDEVSPAPTSIQLPEADPSTRIHAPEIIARLRDPDLQPVDVREADEYGGELTAPAGYEPIAQRAGHIPGAALVPWGGTIREDGTFRSAAELRAHYAAAGITGDETLFTYCGVGVRSSHSWFVLHELLGFNDVRNYDGSWAEWGSMIGVPIENPAAAS